MSLALAAVLAASALPFSLGGGGAVVVPVFLEGKGPYPFRLDTGASGTVVTKEVAGAVGVRPVARTIVVTPVGEETRTVGRIGSVRAGEAVANGVLATLAPGLPGGVAGILGQDFLSRFDCTIDYRRREISWDRDAAAAEGVRVPLHPYEGIFLVDVVQRGTAARFVPDSGAGALVVFEGAGPGLTAEREAEEAELATLSGRRVRVALRRLRGLSIGPLALREQVAAFVPRDEGHAGGGDGLLPLHHFGSVTFASRDGYLVIRP